MSDRKYLILGASGYLGRALYRIIGSEKSIATYRSRRFDGGVQFDASLGELNSFLNDLNTDIQAAILLFGETKIDACAKSPDATVKINVTSYQKVIKQLVEREVRIIFASSDAVYDGSRSLWTEEDIPNPILTYGKQKLAVENYLARNSNDYVIARLSKIIGRDPDQDNPLFQWMRQLLAGEMLHSARDAIFSPIDVEDAALGLLRLADAQVTGIYNLCGTQAISRWDLVENLITAIAKYRKVPGRNVPCSIRDFPFVEARPLDVSMRPDKFLNATNVAVTELNKICAVLVEQGQFRERTKQHLNNPT
jgi:dTDP-4-dehydrorhamnose reductase